MEICKKEFSKDNFFFITKSRKQFYEFQWNKDRKLFLLYKTAICVYFIGWLVIKYALHAKIKQLFYFTNYQEILMNLYFIQAAAVSYKGWTSYKTNEEDQDQLLWYHKLLWLLHTLAFVTSFVTVTIYWIWLAPTLPTEKSLNPFAIHVHVTTIVAMIVDIFLVAFPVRVLHFLYGLVLGFCYLLYTYVLYLTGVTSAVYPFLDWENKPGFAVLVGASLIVGAVVAQSFVYLLYRLRVMCVRKATATQNTVDESYLAATKQHNFTPDI